MPNQDEKRTTKKLISIMTFGTRGDIQAYLAIAIELSKRYDVRFLTNKGYKNFVEGYGVTYVPISEDFLSPETLRKHEELREALSSCNAESFFKTCSDLCRTSNGSSVSMIRNELKAFPPDLFLAGSLTLYWAHFVQKVLLKPMLRLTLQLYGYNRNHAPFNIPVLPFGLHYYDLLKTMVSRYKYFSYYDDKMAAIGEPRLCSILSEKKFHYDQRNILIGRTNEKRIICVSSLIRDVLYPNLDPEKYLCVGACVLDSTQQSRNINHFGGRNNQCLINEFIKGDHHKRKPLYFGWGSMLAVSEEFMIKMLLTALVNTGERAIVLGGVARLSMEALRRATSDEKLISYAKENVLFVDEISHENVFPLVKCVVHHGGSGTTQAALRAGVPSIVTPIWLDQFCFSKAVNRLGVGIGFNKELRKITSEELSEAIIQVISSDAIYHESKKVAKHMHAEGGKVEVAKIVDEILQGIEKNDPMMTSPDTKLIMPEIFVNTIMAMILMFAITFVFLKMG